jgi:hypothetical protein
MVMQWVFAHLKNNDGADDFSIESKQLFSIFELQDSKM